MVSKFLFPTFILLWTILGSEFGHILGQNTDAQTTGMNRHNQLRRQHNAQDLALNDMLNSIATTCAGYLAGIGMLVHNCTQSRGFGENLYRSGDTSLSDSAAVIAATDVWYNEVKLYNFNNPGFFNETGHFTQLVWKASQRLGIGIARMNNQIFVTAVYDPQGNFGATREYPANVERRS